MVDDVIKAPSSDLGTMLAGANGSSPLANMDTPTALMMLGSILSKVGAGGANPTAGGAVGRAQGVEGMAQGASRGIGDIMSAAAQYPVYQADLASKTADASLKTAQASTANMTAQQWKDWAASGGNSPGATTPTAPVALQGTTGSQPSPNVGVTAPTPPLIGATGAGDVGRADRPAGMMADGSPTNPANARFVTEIPDIFTGSTGIANNQTPAQRRAVANSLPPIPTTPTPGGIIPSPTGAPITVKPTDPNDMNAVIPQNGMSRSDALKISQAGGRGYTTQEIGNAYSILSVAPAGSPWLAASVGLKPILDHHQAMETSGYVLNRDGSYSVSPVVGQKAIVDAAGKDKQTVTYDANGQPVVANATGAVASDTAKTSAIKGAEYTAGQGGPPDATGLTPKGRSDAAAGAALETAKLGPAVGQGPITIPQLQLRADTDKTAAAEDNSTMSTSSDAMSRFTPFKQVVTDPALASGGIEAQKLAVGKYLVNAGVLSPARLATITDQQLLQDFGQNRALQVAKENDIKNLNRTEYTAAKDNLTNISEWSPQVLKTAALAQELSMRTALERAQTRQTLMNAGGHAQEFQTDWQKTHSNGWSDKDTQAFGIIKNNSALPTFTSGDEAAAFHRRYGDYLSPQQNTSWLAQAQALKGK
jgi:hypothetical protein